MGVGSTGVGVTGVGVIVTPLSSGVGATNSGAFSGALESVDSGVPSSTTGSITAGVVMIGVVTV